MKNNSGHIVILIPGFAADENDESCLPGLQSYPLNLKKIAPDKLITIIAFHYPFISHSYLWNGIQVHAIGGKNKKYFFKIITWIKVLGCFYKINRENRVSSIQSFWLRECTLIGLLLSKLYNINFIATLQGLESKRDNVYLKLFRFFDFKVVSGSQFNADVYQETTGKKCTKIIPFGLDEKKISTYNHLQKPARTIDIIGVGSLIPIKNYSLFLDIIHEVVVDFPHLRVVILGGGVEQKMLERKVISLGLSKNIEFKGQEKSREKLMSLLGDAKILLHTSSHEGQCFAFLEALSMGLHVVSFKVGYLPDTKKSHAFNSKSEMILELKKVLSSPMDNSLEKIISMEETAEEFNKILL